MLSRPTQSLLVQARVEELHRVAQTSNRRNAVARHSSDVNRPETAPPSTRVKRALGRVFDGRPAGSDEAAAIHGVQLVGHASATNWSRQC
jgi:hypothetical protein